jgi:hypothetical protein
VICALVLVPVFYAILRDPNAPRNALAPAPGAVPLPDRAHLDNDDRPTRAPARGPRERRSRGPGREDRAAVAEARTAPCAELQTFRAKAIELGHPSLATAALIGWEWLQREEDIFATFDVTH